MQRPGTGSNAARRLNFTMTLPSGAIWSIRGNGTGSEFNSGLLNIGANSTLTGSEVISFSMNGGSTRATQGLDRFPFTVQAAIEPSFTITATSDVNLGPRSASETNITGSNSSAITVNCTTGGSYYIGLKPSNNSTTGAGVMSGTGGNLDKVPYQLRSNAGINGTIWSNTATSTTVGNGVADFGTGSNKIYEVFIKVPTADFKPDNYSDTVTINVNY